MINKTEKSFLEAQTHENHKPNPETNLIIKEVSSTPYMYAKEMGGNEWRKLLSATHLEPIKPNKEDRKRKSRNTWILRFISNWGEDY